MIMKSFFVSQSTFQTNIKVAALSAMIPLNVISLVEARDTRFTLDTCASLSMRNVAVPSRVLVWLPLFHVVLVH